MLSIDNILETNQMIHDNKLDVRTITMGSYVIAFMIALQKKQNTLYLQVKILSASSVFLSSTSVFQ